MKQVKVAVNDDEIMKCYPIMRQLHPHLVEESFVTQIKKLMKEKFYLLYIEKSSVVVAVSGFHVCENLGNGKYLYLDDLVTDAKHRSKGYGKALLDWIFAFAVQHKIRQVVLDSEVQKFEAHRFYLQNNMKISCHHFSYFT